MAYTSAGSSSDSLLHTTQRLPAFPGRQASLVWLTDASNVASHGDALVRTAESLLSHGQTDTAVDDLEKARSYYKAFLSKHPSVGVPAAYPTDERIILSLMQGNVDYVTQLEDLAHSTQEGELEQTLAILGPILLGLGIGIRIAKVSSKLFVPA